MTGLSRFDFYPRDWISGTRTLSPAARGIYIDLIAVMYDRGEALEHDERWLCRLLGLRDRRQLRPLLDELIDQGKVKIVDGKIINGRAMHEIESAQVTIANAAKGGRAKAKRGSKADPVENIEKDLFETGTSEAPARHQRGTSTPIKQAGIEEKQAHSPCPPSPSPSPSPSKTLTVDREEFKTFWRVYPSRKPHSNPKKPARAKFDAAVKRGVSPADIIRGAKNYALCIERENSDPKYTAQAQTWLNQERWGEYQEDVPVQTAKGRWL